MSASAPHIEQLPCGLPFLLVNHEFVLCDNDHSAMQTAGVHFVLRGKNAGNFELLSLMSKSHARVVSVPGGGTILCSSLYDICCLLSYKFQE